MMTCENKLQTEACNAYLNASAVLSNRVSFVVDDAMLQVYVVT